VKFAIMRFSRLTLLLLAYPATGGSAAAEFSDFRDWYAACDNLRNCSAYGLQVEEPTYAYMRVERSGAPSASAKITIVADVNDKATVALAFDDASLRGLPSGPVAFKRDGQDSYGRLVIDDPTAVEMLLASIPKARTLVLSRIDPPGSKKSNPETIEISMPGAVAALSWIDEQQQRLGTTTALIRRGDKSASSIPPQPKAPIVQATKPPPTDRAPPPPSMASVLVAKAKALCGDDDETRLKDTVRLDRDKSLHSFSCPSSSGAYNIHSVFLIVPDANPQAARPVDFAYPTKIGSIEPEPGKAYVATNAGFDGNTMTLSTFSKGRGLADCGTAEDWVWDGQTFRLTLLRKMPHCKGIVDDDWPVLYRAERK
jgi:hypothetical protein